MGECTFVCLQCICNMQECALVWGSFFVLYWMFMWMWACLCSTAVCVYVQYAVYVEPSLGVYINEHLSVSLMPYSIWPPILCVQLIARTSAGVCVFLTLANRSMALHTNVPLHQPHPMPAFRTNTLKWHFNFQVDTLIQSKLSKG